MSWGKLDDQFHSHPKVIAGGNEVAGVYARAISYCAAYYTDGFVSRRQAASFAVTRVLKKVTTAGFWEEVEPGETRVVTGRRDSGNRALPDVTVTFDYYGFFIDDFLHYHPTRGEAEAAREKRRSAGSRGGQASAVADAQANASASAKQMTKHTRPDPKEEVQRLVGNQDSIEADFHALRLFRAVRERFQTPGLRREIVSYAHKLAPADFQSVIDSLEKHRREIKNEDPWVRAALEKRFLERRAA